MSREDFPPPRPSFFAADRDRKSTSSLDSSSDSEPSQHRQVRRSRRGSAEWNATSLYNDTSTPTTPFVPNSRPPPSSFFFPFQHHPGNPDPGTHVPFHSRRSSIESLHSPNNYSASSQSSHQVYSEAPSQAVSRAESVEMLSPVTAPRTVSSAVVNPIPRTSSASTFRAPFLSPASRPSSSLWSPPSHPFLNGGYNSSAGSSTALSAGMFKNKAPAPSTKLVGKLTKEDKPWMGKKTGKERISWWITVFGLFLGLAGGAVLVWRSVISVELLKDSELYSVLEEDWSNGISNSSWVRDVELGGFGNGEFQMCTASSSNSYIHNNQLYILPTLTSDIIGKGAIFDGHTYNLTDCSTSNATACSATSSSSSKSVINPVMSARLSTQGKHTIKYGKVEVVAKLPQGDWLWPAIWMLPEKNAYGAWPLSGEIDIMEARGNGPSYGGQGYNFVRSSLNYGPLPSLVTKFYGWWQVKRGGFNEGFHTYTLEWENGWMRMYVDTRLHATLKLDVKKGGQSFWNRGHYPSTAQNGSTEVVVSNPWSHGNWNAPYDQEFYLLINLAVGGTSGWFPDGVGDKPWHDASATAMHDFASAQDTWSATWPTSADERAFRISSVKMWKLKDGSC